MTPWGPLVAVTILWVAAVDAAAADAVPQRDVHPGAAPATPLAAQHSLDQLSATRDRPLFSPTRRPPAPPPVIVPAAPPPPPPPEVVLLGVVMDGEQARAVVRVGQEAKTVRVQIGDAIGGWEVRQIEAKKLVLLLHDRTATFNMFTAKKANRFPGAGSTAQSRPPQHSNLARPLPSTPLPSSADGIPASRRRHPQPQ